MKDEFGRFKFLDPMRGVCYDPATLTAIGMSAGTAGTIGSVASVLGPVLSVASALSEMSAAQAQAKEHERAGIESQVSANRQAQLERRRARQRMSAERAGQIEGGVYSGTALDLELQNYLAAEEDAMMIEYGGLQAGKSAAFRAAQARRSATPLKVFTAAIDGFSQFDPLNLAATGGAGLQGGAGSSMAPLRPA